VLLATVAVGRGVDVAGGRVEVGTGVEVGAGVHVGGPGVVGKAEGAARVGKGVEPKPNNAVGLGCVPAAVGRTGLGVIPGALRDRSGNNPSGIEQRQQNRSKAREGISILTACPCWPYFSFNAERYKLTCSTILYH